MPSRNRQKPLLASEARARFSELLEQVMAQPGTAVYIGHRARKGSAVLVDSAHYEMLQHQARAANSSDREPFRLAGSLIPLVSADEQEARMQARRQRQAELAAAKRASL